MEKTLHLEITTERITVSVKYDHCKHCGEKNEDCRYPVSHGVPTIDSITLPADANNIALRYKRGESTAAFTAFERELWDRASLLGHANF